MAYQERWGLVLQWPAIEGLKVEEVRVPEGRCQGQPGGDLNLANPMPQSTKSAVAVWSVSNEFPLARAAQIDELRPFYCHFPPIEGPRLSPPLSS